MNYNWSKLQNEFKKMMKKNPELTKDKFAQIKQINVFTARQHLSSRKAGKIYSKYNPNHATYKVEKYKNQLRSLVPAGYNSMIEAVLESNDRCCMDKNNSKKKNDVFTFKTDFENRSQLRYG